MLSKRVSFLVLCWGCFGSSLIATSVIVLFLSDLVIWGVYSIAFKYDPEHLKPDTTVPVPHLRRTIVTTRRWCMTCWRWSWGLWTVPLGKGSLWARVGGFILFPLGIRVIGLILSLVGFGGFFIFPGVSEVSWASFYTFITIVLWQLISSLETNTLGECSQSHEIFSQCGKSSN